MRIRATVPFLCYVTGATADALSPSFRFGSRNCVVTASLQGEDPLALPAPADEDPWFRKVHSLSIEIDEVETDLVTRVVTSNDPEGIIGCLLKPANRVIRAVRNFGLVTHVREYRISEFSGDHWLDLLSVKTSVDGATWTRLREPPDDLVELLARRSLLRREHLGSFKVANFCQLGSAAFDPIANLIARCEDWDHGLELPSSSRTMARKSR